MNKRKTEDMQSRIIKRQRKEIERLKEEIASLQYECRMKDEMIESFDDARYDMKNAARDISSSRDEYARTVKELREMKRVMNQEVFKGRWFLIKLLMK